MNYTILIYIVQYNLFEIQPWAKVFDQIQLFKNIQKH